MKNLCTGAAFTISACRQPRVLGEDGVWFPKKYGKTLEKAVLLKNGLTFLVNTPLDALPADKRALHEEQTRALEQCFVAHRPKVEAMLQRPDITPGQREMVRDALLRIPFRN